MSLVFEAVFPSYSPILRSSTAYCTRACVSGVRQSVFNAWLCRSATNLCQLQLPHLFFSFLKSISQIPIQCQASVNSIQTLICLIPITTQWGRRYSKPCFADGEMQTRGDEGSCPKSHIWKMVDSGSEPKWPRFRSAVNYYCLVVVNKWMKMTFSCLAIINMQ